MSILYMYVCFSGKKMWDRCKTVYFSVFGLSYVCVVHDGRMQAWVCADVSCPDTLWLAVNTGNYNFPHKEQVHLKHQCNH